MEKQSSNSEETNKGRRLLPGATSPPNPGWSRIKTDAYGFRVGAQARVIFCRYTLLNSWRHSDERREEGYFEHRAKSLAGGWES